MKLFYEFFPILLFFIVYKLYGIYAATLVAIVAVGAQVCITFLRGKRPEMMHWITLAMMVVLGGATLLLQNELFIKFKPTAVYWALGLAFFLSRLLWKKNLVQKLLQNSLELPEHAWSVLNTSWVLFFMIMGVLNLIVVWLFDTNTWVNFKLFGTLVLTLVFAIVQAFLVSRYLPKEATSSHKER